MGVVDRFGLFRLTGGTWTKVEDLRGGYGTTGDEVVFALPLRDLGLRAGGKLSEFDRHGVSTNNVLAGPHTHLGWLGDVFVLPFRVPFASILSIGDLLIVMGMVAFVYRTCAPKTATRSGNVFAPLRSAAFRRAACRPIRSAARRE